MAAIVLRLVACLVLMTTCCHSYPPHYPNYWQRETPSYNPSQVPSWNSGGSYGDSGGGGRERGSDSFYATRRTDHQGHQDHYHRHRHHDDDEEGGDWPQQSPSYANTGVYGVVPTRGAAGHHVPDGGVSVGQRQGERDEEQQGGRGQEGEYPNELGVETTRRKSRPIVNVRRGRRNESSSVVPDMSGTPHVVRRPDGTLELVYPQHRAAPRGKRGAQQDPMLSDGRHGGSDFIFPQPSEEDDDMDENSRRNPPTTASGNPVGYVPSVTDRRKGPRCARGTTFCEDIEEYPSDYLSSILQKEARGYMDLFGEDEVESNVSIANRIDPNDDIPLCSSREQVVFPKAAQNKNDEWHFIVNLEGFVQGVRVEMCADPEGKCANFNLPLNFETGCKQKYIYRKLLALNGTGNTITDTFRLPSCCSCFIRQARTATRIASPFLEQRTSTGVKSKGSYN